MNLTPLQLNPNDVLYEQVAARLQRLITDGTLQPGDRLPSVRKLRQQLSVSTATVLEAYRLLEDQGLIFARPQSGYYVKAAARPEPPEPTTPTNPSTPSAIDISLAFELISAMRNPDFVQLGAVLPAIELLPLAKLNRLMGKILREDPANAHAYGSPQGEPSLRAEVAKRLLDAGCSVPLDQLVITNGANEAIYFALQAVTQPGDTVVVESPTYFAMLEALKSLQLQALPLPTHPRDGISLSHLETALQTQSVAACLLVSNFSNPLGSCMDDAKKQQLITLLNQSDTPLIEDDVYGELVFEGSRPKAIKAFDTEDRVLYCSSVSKTLSPGLRVGWCAGGRYQARVSQLKSILNQCTAVPLQLTVAEFLANGGYDRHLRQLRRAYQNQMHQMRQAIAEYFPVATCVTRPLGGHVLWLELPEGLDTLQLYWAARDRQIAIAPGVMFSVSGQDYRNCLRLNTALPWSPAIAQAVQALGQLAESMMLLG
ncbi:MAG: PLP-dependent aminotransferase family protein [Spirulinaceae cyanobacterium]